MATVFPVIPALAEAIKARLVELRMSQQDLVNASGVTRQGLRPLLRGEKRDYQPRLKYPVCHALGWTADSIDRLLVGKEPKLVDPSQQPLANGGLPRDIGAHLVQQVGEMSQLLRDVADEVRQLRNEWRRDSGGSAPGSP